jgi:hypothetical protein
MLWNDPTVLKEGNAYRMWLSGGDPRDLQHIAVDIYSAQSVDGISWTIDPKPVLPAAYDTDDWDNWRVETPSVIKVGDTYHMYYSGMNKKDERSGIYRMGHATSRDGVYWTKDPANPVIIPQVTDPFKWGYGGIGEPGVVFNPNDQTFYLYYVGGRFAKANPTIGQVGILLATSKDGSHFTNYVDLNDETVLILGRDIPGATSGAWFGYSTPSAVIAEDGNFHLFCAFLVAPIGPASARHVTLSHAISRDGIQFTVVEQDFAQAGQHDWKDQQVRSPSVIVDHGQFKMWFAGEMTAPYFGAGIGFAARYR